MASNRQRFRIHEDNNKENDKVPGSSRWHKDSLIRSAKVSGSSKDSALRDRQANVLPPERAKFKTSSSCPKSYDFRLKQEINDILAEGKKGVHQSHDHKSVKASASAVQSEQLKRPSSLVCPGGCNRIISASRNVQFQRGEGGVHSRQDIVKAESKSTLKERTSYREQNASATDVQSEQLKRPGLSLCTERCNRIISASRNVQFQRGDGGVQIRQDLFKPESKSTLKEKNSYEEQIAQKTRALSLSTTMDTLGPTLPINSTRSRKSTGSIPIRGQITSSTPKLRKSTPTLGKPTPKVEKSQNELKKYSPIKPNRFTSSNTLITRQPKCQRNAKLTKRAVKRSASGGFSYVGDIYNEEYLEVIMKIIVEKERRIVLPTHFLEKFNPDRKFRASIVNWMLETQGQIVISDEVFYLAVNLLDQVLARITVPVNMYQLLALSTMWIANKLIGSDRLRASTLTELCGSAYLKYQLLRMERKVLKIMNFEIHSIEPSLCVNYYLRILEIDQLQLARFSVYYILECSTLLPEFSSSRVSILTAAAVNVAIKLYCRDLEEKSSEFFSRNLSVGDIEKRKSLESMMYSQILNMSSENYLFREAYYKYSFVSNRIPFV